VAEGRRDSGITERHDESGQLWVVSDTGACVTVNARDLFNLSAPGDRMSLPAVGSSIA